MAPALRRQKPSPPQWEEGFVVDHDVKIHSIEKKVPPSKRPSLLFIPGLSMPGWVFENVKSQEEEGTKKSIRLSS